MDPTVTDWITALTGVGTLAAAATAGAYAARAAHWTKAQAEAAQEEVRTATEALAVARADAEVAKTLADHQLEQSARAARRAAEARVDGLMPAVLAKATPGRSVGEHAALLEVARRSDGDGRPYPDWKALTAPLEVRDDETVAFRIHATIELTNHSEQIARVNVIDPGHAEVSLPSGSELVLAPRETRHITWTRVIGSGGLRTEEAIAAPGVWLFNPRLWVRDVGLNAYDVLVFSAGLPFFRRDGSRLQVNPGISWTESTADVLPDRVYDRLNAAGDGARSPM